MKSFIFCLYLIFGLNGYTQSLNVNLLGNWQDPQIMDWYGDKAFNEVWGFVQNGQEYAVIGAANSTNVIKINDDNSLERVEWIEGRHVDATHRDYHDYKGYLYEVCDQGASTLRIYDMQYLPDSLHMVYDDSLHLARAHNIFIDSTSGLLYACGVTYGTFDVPMRVLSLADPVNPTLAYDYHFVDYVHDVYVRNDSAYLNAANEGLRVVDFSNPSMPLPLGSLSFYIDQGYNHSGWLNEDGTRYVMCDETAGMRFKLLDVSDLLDIQVLNYTKPPTFEETLPHNVMFMDGLAYFSYYADGFQVYDLRDPSNLKRLAYYDSYQGEDNIFKGAWGVYTYLPSGKLLLSDRTNGLFVFDYNPPPNFSEAEFEFQVFPNLVEDGLTYFYGQHSGEADYTIQLFSDDGKLVDQFNGTQDYLEMNLSHLSNGIYFYRYVDHLSNRDARGKLVVDLK